MFLLDLEIENLRAIRSMKVDFRNGGDNARRWTVLFGENGCGKSTILKAIGLVLAGSSALPRLIGNVDDWIQNRQKTATIRATLRTERGEQREVSLTLKRGDDVRSLIIRNQKRLSLLDAALKHADRNYFVVGYGAFRRPPDQDEKSIHRRSFSENDRAAHLATLFSGSPDLVGLERWAMDLDYRKESKGQDLIKAALAKLLPKMRFKHIDKKRRAIVMQTVDGDVFLQNLSEGYQAMAAWAGDILYRMTETFTDRKDPLAARGLLLIDEMDLHLHPIWKRGLVDFLNAAFPNLQIVATTHSPLSIQECNEGELFVVQRPNRKQSNPKLVAFSGDPSKMRLSELFLSPLIGLDTLDSPKVSELRKRAREIELAGDPTTTAAATELSQIRAKLEGTEPLPSPEAPALAEVIKLVKSARSSTGAKSKAKRKRSAP